MNNLEISLKNSRFYLTETELIGLLAKDKQLYLKALKRGKNLK